MSRHIMLVPMPHHSITHPQVDIILNSQKIILSTHRNSDGDGIGSLVGLYWALKALNKEVSFFPVDEVPKRYSYMLENVAIASDLKSSKPDLLIILDTNQGELCNPLYQSCIDLKTQILFIDHHVVLPGENPSFHRIINLEAASTGEIVFDIINALNVPMNDLIAIALYSSLTFDTQAFKLVKNSSRSHFIAGELAKFKINTEKIQRALFAHWTPEKMNFLADLIQRAKYFSNQQIVGLHVSIQQLEKYHLQGDDVNDLIDMFTLIPTVKFAYIIRQVQKNEFKISFRSSLSNYAYLVALSLGGGGHYNSAGTWMNTEDFSSAEAKVLKELSYLKLLD